MTDDPAVTSYSCPYCRTTSSGEGITCPNCGAPVDVALRTTSGWTELPAIPDMTRVQMGHSSAQILGKLAPAIDVRLATDEGVFFPDHTLLWQEPDVRVSALGLKGAWDRMRAGLPLVMLQAAGPGTISFSHDSPGEMVVLPLEPGSGVDVREHCLVVATSAVGYDWFESGVWFSARAEESGGQSGGAGLLRMGLDAVGIDAGGLDGRDDRRDDEIRYHYPFGRYVDRFFATDARGAVVIQAGGNCFVRDLGDGESILVKPPALLFKDPTVGYQLHVEYPGVGMKFWRTWGNRYLWLRLVGPGRVGLQSSYERLEDPGTDFQSSSQYTQQAW